MRLLKNIPSDHLLIFVFKHLLLHKYANMVNKAKNITFAIYRRSTIPRVFKIIRALNDSYPISASWAKRRWLISSCSYKLKILNHSFNFFQSIMISRISKLTALNRWLIKVTTFPGKLIYNINKCVIIYSDRIMIKL